jgi:GT2 family glycosyltransferase
MPQISVITALHNCVELTRSYLDSLRSTLADLDWELILVDDASRDATPELLEELSSDPRITCIRNPVNLGYAASNNLGASAARAPILALLNNDLTLTPGWIEPMMTCLATQESCGIVGNTQINPRNQLIDHAGVFFGLDGMPRQARKHRAKGPAAEFTEWHAVTAACMLLRKSTFDEAGGFDEGYRNGFEDIDLCVRLKQLGYRHYTANRSKVFHHVSSSPGRHHHNDLNAQRFAARWASGITREWGQLDWPYEYLKRYARHWWKLNFRKTLLALRMILKDQKRKVLIHRH